MLDAVLGSTGSPWIPEHHPGGFQQRPQCVPAGGQGDGGTGSDIPAVPCLPELPCTSAPCQAAAPRSFSSISFTSNCLLQPPPSSSQNQEGAPWPRLCRGDLGSIHSLGRALPQRSLELRTSRASAPVLDREQSLICLGHSGGLGTSFSRNAALTGHNSCCAASLPGMGFLGHTLGSHRALPPLPSLVLLLSVLSSSTSPLKSALRSSTSPRPFPTQLDSPARGEWFGRKHGRARWIQGLHLPLPVFPVLFPASPRPVLHPDRSLLHLWEFV